MEMLRAPRILVVDDEAAAVHRAGYEAHVELSEPFMPAEPRSLRARLGLGR